MTMIMVNIYEAKARLSDLLERVSAGERILICKRNQPIAELRPVATARKTPRTIGGARGMITIPATFFDPLPTDDVDAFESSMVFPSPESGGSRVAEGASRIQSRIRPRGRAPKKR